MNKLTIGAVIEKPGSSLNTKTGAWRTLRPIWHQDRCIQCMLCWMFCPDIAVPENTGKRIETNYDYCKGCGICAQVCPVKCIDMVKEEK